MPSFLARLRSRATSLSFNSSSSSQNQSQSQNDALIKSSSSLPAAPFTSTTAIPPARDRQVPYQASVQRKIHPDLDSLLDSYTDTRISTSTSTSANIHGASLSPRRRRHSVDGSTSTTAPQSLSASRQDPTSSTTPTAKDASAASNRLSNLVELESISDEGPQMISTTRGGAGGVPGATFGRHTRAQPHFAPSPAGAGTAHAQAGSPIISRTSSASPILSRTSTHTGASTDTRAGMSAENGNSTGLNTNTASRHSTTKSQSLQQEGEPTTFPEPNLSPNPDDTASPRTFGHPTPPSTAAQPNFRVSEVTFGSSPSASRSASAASSAHGHGHHEVEAPPMPPLNHPAFARSSVGAGSVSGVEFTFEQARGASSSSNPSLGFGADAGGSATPRQLRLSSTSNSPPSSPTQIQNPNRSRTHSQSTTSSWRRRRSSRPHTSPTKRTPQSQTQTNAPRRASAEWAAQAGSAGGPEWPAEVAREMVGLILGGTVAFPSHRTESSSSSSNSNGRDPKTQSKTKSQTQKQKQAPLTGPVSEYSDLFYKAGSGPSDKSAAPGRISSAIEFSGGGDGYGNIPGAKVEKEKVYPAGSGNVFDNVQGNEAFGLNSGFPSSSFGAGANTETKKTGDNKNTGGVGNDDNDEEERQNNTSTDYNNDNNDTPSYSYQEFGALPEESPSTRLTKSSTSTESRSIKNSLGSASRSVKSGSKSVKSAKSGNLALIGSPFFLQGVGEDKTDTEEPTQTGSFAPSATTGVAPSADQAPSRTIEGGSGVGKEEDKEELMSEMPRVAHDKENNGSEGTTVVGSGISSNSGGGKGKGKATATSSTVSKTSVAPVLPTLATDSSTLVVPPTLQLTEPTPDGTSPSRRSLSEPGLRILGRHSSSAGRAAGVSAVPMRATGSAGSTGSGKGKRKAEEDLAAAALVVGAGTGAEGSRRATTFALPDARLPRISASGSSHAPSSYHRKRAKLSTSTTLASPSPSRPSSSQGQNEQKKRGGSVASRESKSKQSSHAHPSPPRAKHQSQARQSQDGHTIHDGQPVDRSGSRRSLSQASIPFSALMAPHAPSISRSSTFHMRDPRKPPRVQTTGWAPRGVEPRAWAFFVGFVLFFVWWVAAVWRIPPTRRVGGSEMEKGVVLDDPQVEFDARSWRTRCRVMSAVSLFTYIPFIVLVAVYAPR